MNSKHLHILLADDDLDDCHLFDKALKALSLSTNLTIVHNGEQVIHYLAGNSDHRPDVLFLDLSMPRKTGFECLSEIRENEKLKKLPVIMFSTSYPRNLEYEQDMIDTLFKIGADDYIRKPGNFEELKASIHKALIMVMKKSEAPGPTAIGGQHPHNSETISETIV
jgi:CheY-like chemotaxis protein